MKYKLKDIEIDKLKYSLNGIINGNCKLININYYDESLEFQTPKVLIEKIIKENNKEYLLLKILPTEACKTFCTKILSLEDKHNSELNNHKDWFNKRIPISEVKSIFVDDCFTVKIPFKYSKPIIKVYNETGLFNYYKLSKDTTVICLLGLDKIWINQYNEPNYNLIVKEIMVI